MADVGQTREGELRTDQLKKGKVYRMEQYWTPSPGVQHRLINQCLVRFKKRWGGGDIFTEFTIVAPGASIFKLGQNIDITSDTNPTHKYYYRFFETAQDRIVPQFEQRALESVFEKKLDLGKAATWGLTKDFLAPSKKSGGKKHKTRQTKLRSKNRTRKNRRRTHRR